MDGLGVTKVTEVDYCAHPGWLTESLGATGNGFAEQITGGTREVDVFVVLTGRLTKIWFKDVMSQLGYLGVEGRKLKEIGIGIDSKHHMLISYRIYFIAFKKIEYGKIC